MSKLRLFLCCMLAVGVLTPSKSFSAVQQETNLLPLAVVSAAAGVLFRVYQNHLSEKTKANISAAVAISLSSLGLQSLLHNKGNSFESIFDESTLRKGAAVLYSSFAGTLIYDACSYVYHKLRPQNVSQNVGPINLYGNETITFADIGKAIPEPIRDLVEYIKNPTSNEDLGLTAAKGYLFLGPPGTGKTMTARAIAGEVGAHFLYFSAPNLESKWVGETAETISNIFTAAKNYAKKTDKPVIIFIDEIDAIATDRKNYSAAYPWASAALLQLLTEIDRVQPYKKVFIFAATNYADRLDPALKRAGRLGAHIMFELPNLEQRKDVLSRCINKIEGRDFSIDVHYLASITDQFSYADLDAIIKDAVQLTARERRTLHNNTIMMQRHIETAINNVKKQRDSVQAKPAAAEDALRDQVLKMIAAAG